MEGDPRQAAARESGVKPPHSKARGRTGFITLGIAVFAMPAMAETRPTEDELFSSPATQSPLPAAPSPAGDRPDEGALFGSPAKTEPALPPLEKKESVSDDPLKIGGQLYLRTFLSARADTPPSHFTLSAPALVDGYFDARPNDRVRGYVLARMRYDPTVGPGQFPAGPADPGPSVLLDQLWLRFDLSRAVFVTFGKQHVKWGTARFWNPTDYLHNAKRDALAVFDPRVGTTMLKLHFPWEKRGWNFYALGLLDNPEPASAIGRVGGAARAELVFGSAELGLDCVVQRGANPKLGVDLSMGLWDLDVYAEASVRSGADVTRWKAVPREIPGIGTVDGFEASTLPGLAVAGTLGLSWSASYNDNDVLTVGAEVFYNGPGYDDPKVYPWLIYQGQFTPFFAGRSYAALFAVLMGPGSWDTSTFVLSNLGNVSDASFVTRLDYTLVLLTHLRFEVFGAIHYGTRGGELRFGLEIPSREIDGQVTPAVSIAPPMFEAGLGLRVNL